MRGRYNLFLKKSTMNKNTVLLSDISYELQLLLGAVEIVKYINDWDQEQTDDVSKFGNIIN